MRSTHRILIRIALIGLAALMLVALPASFAPRAFMQQGSYEVKQSVIAGGGGASTNNSTRVEGTIGQAVLGFSTGGSFSLAAGFWQPDAPCSAPSISSQPASQVVCAGSPITFSVTATGSSLAYQWRKDGMNISGATSPDFTINSASISDAGSYDVVVTGSCGSSTSNPAMLTVNGYSLSSTSASFPNTGGSGTVSVTAASNCMWTARSNDTWINITSAASGTGNGSVSYSVGSTSSGRTGSLTIAGITFMVSQDSPTAINLISFAASAYERGVSIEWRTGLEVRNLGFNLYRQEKGERTLVNMELIAGSALMVGPSIEVKAGRSYAWWDDGQDRDAVYWLEDLDINGERALHGPFKPEGVAGKAPDAGRAALLSQISSNHGRSISDLPRAMSEGRQVASPNAQWEYASKAAIKLSVREEGWYRVTQPDLLAAGLDPKVDPRLLHLYLDGVEQPVIVAGETDGRFDGTDAVEFYGNGQDTPSTNEHIYWLVAGSSPGKRVKIVKSENKSAGAKSLAHTTELKERSLYFSGLLNGEAENFFGSVITAQAVEEIIPLSAVDADAKSAEIEVALQGVTDLPASPDHQIRVAVNGAFIGRLVYDGREHHAEKLSFYESLLKEGDNTVTLIAEGGVRDVSLLDYIRITYQRRCMADQDALRLTASITNGPSQAIDGFTTPLVRVFDVTEPETVEELAGAITESKVRGYRVTVDVSGDERRLLALTEERIKRPVAITANQPSSLRQPANAADLLILTRREFAPSLEPLVALRRSQGMKVTTADVEDVYDEFNFGEKSVTAIKDFLAYASGNWKVKPRYVLIAGDASYDPKNYLGLGHWDEVPTRLIDTQYLETASDDWLADFDGDGVADLWLGRLPIRTAEEASTMVAKIVGYDRQAPLGEALLVADQNDGYNFEAASHQLGGLMPADVRVNELFRGRLEAATARVQLFDALARGQRIVNYAGHGSVDVWRANLLTNADALGLSNMERLPVFVLMTCLNGYFADPSLDSLAESLLKAERGGAVAVWASSGMTAPEGQAQMNQEFYRLLFNSKGITLGEAAREAKAAVQDADIRRTWVLFGDPTMRLKW